MLGGTPVSGSGIRSTTVHRTSEERIMNSRPRRGFPAGPHALIALVFLLAVPASAGARIDGPLSGAVSALLGSAPSCPPVTQVYAAKNHTPYEVTLACTDADGDPLTYTVDTPLVGTLSAVTGDKVTFTPSG